MSVPKISVPFGYCHCGCGEKTTIAPETGHGYRKGEPRRFIHGHTRVLRGPKYLAQDWGHATPCWIWQGYTEKTGYGRITVNKRRWRAHRWMYEQEVGPIPEGLTLDHLCGVRNCVNPDHLEPVTLVENSLRGGSPWARNRRKTHCLRGHEFTKENTFWSEGSRGCRLCRAIRKRKYYARNKAG